MGLGTILVMATIVIDVYDENWNVVHKFFS